jgi:hypothetical protein
MSLSVNDLEVCGRNIGGSLVVRFESAGTPT